MIVLFIMQIRCM